MFARQFVAEPAPAGDDGLRVVEVLEIVPGGPGADEADNAEPFPALPAQLGLDLRYFVASIARDRRSAQGDIGPKVERFVAKAGRDLAAQPEKQARLQRDELHGDDLAALKLVVAAHRAAEQADRGLHIGAFGWRENIVARIV